MNLSLLSLLGWTSAAGLLWTLRIVLFSNGLVFLEGVEWTDVGTYPFFAFLIWNLFLAWIPYVLSIWLARRKASWYSVGSLIGFAVWLLFLPNAPYLLTDLIHLHPRGNVPYWLDVCLLVTFAVAGWLLGLASLRSVHLRFWSHLPNWQQLSLVTFVLGASSYGVFVGRFLRLNSWDIFTQPLATFWSVLHPLLHPFEFGQALLLVPILGGLLLLSYSSFLTAEKTSIQ
ncbi:MAG: DUF1361 domain-containing protein [Bacteroidota bacterium]